MRKDEITPAPSKTPLFQYLLFRAPRTVSFNAVNRKFAMYKSFAASKIRYMIPAVFLLFFACAGAPPEKEKKTYLSEDWARSVLVEMKTDKEFMRAVQGLNFTVLHEVTGIPGREGQTLSFFTRYGIDEPLSIGIGPSARPDGVFSGSYKTWKKLHSGGITLEEALKQKLITFDGEYHVVILLLERLKRYGKPLSEIYMRVPTVWLD